MTDTSQEMGSLEPAQAAQQFPEFYPQGEVPQAGEVTTFAPSEGGVIPTYGAPPTQDFFAARGLPAGTTPLEASVPSVPLSPAIAPGMQYQTPEQIAAAAQTAPPPQEKGFLGLTKEQALRLGLGGLSALTTGLAGQRGIKQAQQAKQEIADIGKPYREKGAELQAAALRGELTPAGQQQLQAAQAQLAQGIERRGGVGAQQAATQVAAFRQNLLDQQYNYGLKVAQIGDAYAANAIRTGLTQDQEMVRLMSNLAGTLGSVYGGMPNVAGTTTARA